MLAIYKREIKTYFKSPIGYVFLAVLYFFGGYFFSAVLNSRTAQIEYVFQSLFTIILTVIPVLTMRLMSEDKKLKTDQLLLTAPIKLSGIVIGKYLAALTMFLIGISSTIVYSLILAAYTKINWNIFLGNFVALLLLGAALIAIALFISSLTENQVVAAIGSFAIMMFISLFDMIAQVIPVKFISTIFVNLSFFSKYTDLTSGIINIAHILFFVSFIVVFNFLTIRILERKRWN
ncbi:MAG: ABC transporter permease subunit [Oscillospiraceae bacterium]